MGTCTGIYMYMSVFHMYIHVHLVLCVVGDIEKLSGEFRHLLKTVSSNSQIPLK